MKPYNEKEIKQKLQEHYNYIARIKSNDELIEILSEKEKWGTDMIKAAKKELLNRIKN